MSRITSIRPASLAALVALGTFGCIGESADPAPSDPEPCADCAPDVGPDGMAPEPNPQPACLDEQPPLDLLLVIDNSGSMCEEQDALGGVFDAFHDALDGWDWRLPVGSTDIHPDNAQRSACGPPIALPVPSLNCFYEDGSPATPDTADCEDIDGLSVLDSRLFDRAETERRFRCMVNLGTHGDGFEKPLAAAAHALDCAGPNADLLEPCGAADAEFLRPGAALAVIYIGDEDDCSDAGLNENLRVGVECRDNPAPGEPRCTIPRTENSACAWYADDLEPVQTYVEQLRRANPNAVAVTALSLVGPRFEPIDGQPVRFVPGEPEAMCRDADDRTIVSPECCPEGACPGHVRAVCEGALGAAFAGNRLRAMAEAFPGECPDGGCDSLCDGGGMPGLAGRLRVKLDAALPPPCE